MSCSGTSKGPLVSTPTARQRTLCWGRWSESGSSTCRRSRLSGVFSKQAVYRRTNWSLLGECFGPSSIFRGPSWGSSGPSREGQRGGLVGHLVGLLGALVRHLVGWAGHLGGLLGHSKEGFVRRDSDLLDTPCQVVCDISRDTAVNRCRHCRARYSVVQGHPLFPQVGHGAWGPTRKCLAWWSFAEGKSATVVSREIEVDYGLVLEWFR